MRIAALLSTVIFAAAGLAATKPHVVIVTGDHEYSGEQTLALFAQGLERQYGFRCTVLKASPDQNAEENIPGLEALAQADVVIFYLRWRRLPAEQLAHIDAYVKSGKPVLGFRTSSHSFNYPRGDAREAWNRWGSEAFGSPPGWGSDGHTHFGHESSTDVTVSPGAAKHPILQGVAPAFHARSWLYRVLPKWPPPDAERLLLGRPVNPNKAAEENPVAWTWKNSHRGRVFFMTLGHPEDMALEPVQRLTFNAIYWLLARQPAPWKGRLPIDIPYRGIVKTP